MLAIDLDGTLLDSAKQVHPVTLMTIKQIAARMPVVIASARPPRSVRSIYNSLALSTLQINYNGALIWNESAKAPHFHMPMPAALVTRMIDAARDQFEEVEVSCEILDRWYTDSSAHKYATETAKLFRPDVVSPLEKFLHLDVTKLMLQGEPWMMLRLESLIAEAFGDSVSLVRTDDDLIQIMDKRVSKAKAVETVAGTFGLQMDNVLAIGDAPNDYAMVASAGIGVAMGNAHPLVKEVAKWVAPTNDENGVLAALQKFGLA